MPFTGASDPNLPSNVSGLSLAKRQAWVGAWNGRFKDCKADGGTTETCEPSAFAVANAAIKEATMVDASTAEKFSEGPQYWDFISRQMLQNVANYNPVGGTGEKACSNCQWFISPDSCAVVDSYPNPITPNGISDLWRERINRADQMEPLEVIVVGEREAETGAKAETKTEGGVEYPAADFAVVPDTSKSSTWKLRLAEGRAGNFTVAQVARAITAMQPGGFRGNRVSLSSEQKSQAVSRIGRAIGRTGGSDDQKDNLRERLDAVKARSDWWEVLVTGPRTLKDHAMRQLRGLLSQKGIDDDPGIEALTYDSSLSLFKEQSGDIRFVALMSNRYRDRDKEIIPAAAHMEFVAALDTAEYKNVNGEPAMEAWMWHTPGTRWGAVDWAEYVNGFMVVSGLVDKGCEDVADRLAADTELGVSHGFKYLTDERDQSIITQYRSFEFSPLPRAVASNPFTDLAIIQEEVKAMTDNKGIPADKRGFLADKLGEGRVTDLEADTATRDASLQNAGVDFKGDGEGANKPADKGAAADGTPTQKETIEALAEAAVKAVTESKVITDITAGLQTIAEAVKTIDTRLKAVEQTDDDKVGALFKSRVGDIAAKRPSQNGGNAIEKDEASKEGVPQADIFEEVTDGLRETLGLPSGI